LGALVASRLARSLLFAVSPTDPLVFGGTALLLGATAGSPATCLRVARCGSTRW